MVGKLYPQGDPRRDGAFTIFYMGINLGAFFSPLVCGYARRAAYGWHYGFAAAGVGMVIGLVIFLVGQKYVLKAVEEAGHSLKTGKEKVAEEHAANRTRRNRGPRASRARCAPYPPLPSSSSAS